MDKMLNTVYTSVTDEQTDTKLLWHNYTAVAWTFTVKLVLQEL